MILLQCSHTSKSFGSEVILHDVSLSVQTKERVGLVGANGAGKTTLLKIIGGQMESDHGQVSFAKDVQIGYLSQNSTPNSSRTVWEEMLSAYTVLLEQENELRSLEDRIGDLRFLQIGRSIVKFLTAMPFFRNNFALLAVIPFVLTPAQCYMA